MRVVIDTNVLLSAMFTRGVCEAVFDACLKATGCTVVLSEYILGEFSRQAEASFGASPDEVRAAVEFLRRRTELVEPADVPVDVCADADDLPVLGTAVAGGAHCLVTGDRALLQLGRFGEFVIMAPRALYERLP